MRMIFGAMIAALAGVSVAAAWAESPQTLPIAMHAVSAAKKPLLAGQGNRSVLIRGRESATVVQSDIRLSDIAEVSSSMIADDEAVIALKSLVVAQSPAPGQEVKIAAEQILEVLRNRGVDLERVGYLFPRTVRVERASRTVGVPEVASAILAYLKGSQREAGIQNVIMPADVRVPPRATELQVVPMASTRPGHQGFQVTVKDEGKSVRTFDVQAALDEWTEMPVARRPVPRGELITGDDVVMARVNLSALPRDAATKLESVVGLRASRDIGQGDLFHRQQLEVPPLVQAGERVTLMYRSRMLEASVSAVALESGALGDTVRMKNESSKKILSGVITAQGVVEVKS